MKCPNCAVEFVNDKLGRPRKFCSEKCLRQFEKITKAERAKNRIRKRNCPNCNTEFEIGYKQQQKYCSVNCYPSKISPKQKPCTLCSTPIIIRRNYCDTCVPIRLAQVAEANRVHRPEEAETTRKGKRRARERNAIGLSQNQRTKLLATWKSQERKCVYCWNKPANTIDHVIPLNKNGTHELTNLVPCCRSCNARKSDKLPSEWKSQYAGTCA